MKLPRWSERLAVDIALGAAGWVMMVGFTHSAGVAEFVDLPRREWQATIFWVCMAMAALFMLLLASRLSRRVVVRARSLRGLRRAEVGVLTTEFLLLLPTLALIMCLVIHMALVSQAVLVVRYAAYSAARIAAVNYNRTEVADGEEELVNLLDMEEGAAVALATVSPVSQIIPTRNAVANALIRILQNQGEPWSNRDINERTMYGYIGSVITIEEAPPPAEATMPEGSPAIDAPMEFDLTLAFNFAVVIPGISSIPGLTVEGPPLFRHIRAVPLSHTVRMQTWGPRQTSPESLERDWPQL